MAVSEFSTVARLPLRGAGERQRTPTVTDATIASIFDPYITNDYNPSGSTHWEDAFRIGRYFLPRPSQATPHLVVFITDGDPNEVVREDQRDLRPRQHEHRAERVRAQGAAGRQRDDRRGRRPGRATGRSRTPTRVKAQGSHILTVAVGSGLNSRTRWTASSTSPGPTSSTARARSTSPPTTSTGCRTSTTSRTRCARRRSSSARRRSPCASSSTQTPDPAHRRRDPGEGWEHDGHGRPDAGRAGCCPPGATGATATSTTDADGFVNFQWTTAAPDRARTSITVEDPVVQPGYVNDPVGDRVHLPDAGRPGRPAAAGFTPDDGGFSDDGARRLDRHVPDGQPRSRPRPRSTSRSRPTASTPTPPRARSSRSATRSTWTYLVTNTGNVTLSGIAVTDDQGVAVTCPATDARARRRS